MKWLEGHRIGFIPKEVCVGNYYESGLLGAKPMDLPIETNHKLALAQGPNLDDPTMYRWLVGQLIELTITWPELSYAVHILSQIMHKPKEEHIEADRQVLRYLKGRPGQRLLLRVDSDL